MAATGASPSNAPRETDKLIALTSGIGRRPLAAILLVASGCCPDPAGPGGHRPAGPTTAPAPVPVRPFRFADPDFLLLVTGGTHGMLEVCNCSGPMPGGLARRSGLVRSYRAAFDRTVLIDTGDVFWVDPDDVRNDYVLKGYKVIGYDAVALGDQELAAPADRLGRLLAQADLPYLATTVSPTGAATVAAIERTWPRAKLAVVADLRKSSLLFVSPERVKQLSLRPPAQLAERIARLKQAGYVVVVAAHMDEEELAIAAAGSQADLLIRGHTTRSEKALLRVAGKPVVKVGGYETLGAVAVKVRDGRIVDIDYRSEVIDTRWPLDKRLLEVYQAYAHAAMRRALDAKRTEGLDYVSSAACGKCHPRQLASWRKTPHAHAWQTLQKVKRTGDPNCLMCHTSGFGTKKGFYTFRKTPKLAGVNCQDCHRFNVAEHHEKSFKIPRVGEDVCTTCHTPVTDPKFSFKKKLPHARCAKGKS